MSRLRAVVVVLLLLGVTAGCANIPEQSNPQVAGPSGTAEPENTIDPIAPDAKPETIAREFVQHASNPDIARQYLTPAAQKAWRPDAVPMIIEDTFATIPPVVREPNSDGSEQSVVIKGPRVGRLALDNAFYPATGTYEDRITVQRQPDGQWRISKPPATMVITVGGFQSDYRQASLFFFDAEGTSTVPDLRYVAQRPIEGLGSRLLQVLLSGPSDALKGPLHSMIPESTGIGTNPVVGQDGDLVVNLTNLGDVPLDTRKKIAAQVVLSLSGLAPGAIKLLSDNTPLVPGHERWRFSEVPSYTASSTPTPDLPGMFTAGGRVRSLKDGSAIPGPAGAGQYSVQSAAQSIDGGQLAVVEKTGGKVRLRVGKVNGPLGIVQLTGTTMTRPTWLHDTEVWTVLNRSTVTRLVRTKDGTWSASAVESSALTQFGDITALRLSRDGTRLAMVAGEHLVVAGVDRNRDTVTVKGPRTLLQNQLGTVVGVDWFAADKLAVATSALRESVLTVPFDGSGESIYNIANLDLPVRSITAVPSQPLIVTDNSSRMWTSSEPGEAWRSQGSAAADPVPFYPG